MNSEEDEPTDVNPIVKLLARVVVGFVAIYVLFVAVYWFMGASNGGCC